MSEEDDPEPRRPGPRPITTGSSPAPRGLRAMLVLRTGPRRWPGALRAAICMGTPVLIGWLAGDLTAGLTATMGGFAALYGSGRPYRSRAVLLAVVALGLSAAVALGMWAATVPLAGVITVAVIATIATTLCTALRVGPPGAYHFALVCAIGTGLHAQDVNPARIGLTVLVGATFAWLVHMGGALLRPRGPEIAATRAAGNAVASYVDPDAGAVGTGRSTAARHAAAVALQQAWTVLIDQQPRRGRPSATVLALREVCRSLEVLLADAISTGTSGRMSVAAIAARARALARDPLGQVSGTGVAADESPIERPGAVDLVTSALRPHTRSLLIIGRVGIAALAAGLLGGLLSLDHAYWAIATAVLVLHQGLDRRRTTQRALERCAGTGLGLGLAAGLVALDLRALALVVAIAALTFLIELTITKNYPLAVIFITGNALLIASSGVQSTDVGTLVLARGLDTLVGSVVALAVFWVTVPTQLTTHLPTAVANTLDASGHTIGYLSSSMIGTPDGRAARRDLLQRTLRLTQMFEIALNGATAQRRDTERRSRAVTATQRVAYRVLAECWRLQRQAAVELPPEELDRLRADLAALATAARADRSPTLILPEPPAPLAEELLDLRAALAQNA